MYPLPHSKLLQQRLLLRTAVETPVVLRPSRCPPLLRWRPIPHRSGAQGRPVARCPTAVDVHLCEGKGKDTPVGRGVLVEQTASINQEMPLCSKCSFVHTFSKCFFLCCFFSQCLTSLRCISREDWCFPIASTFVDPSDPSSIPRTQANRTEEGHSDPFRKGLRASFGWAYVRAWLARASCGIRS